MQQSFDILFATSNRFKFAEAKTILASFDIRLGRLNKTLQEIQGNSLRQIAKYKAQYAYKIYKHPVVVEDDGLFIDSLSGFPGPYSKYVYETIGNKGVLRLLQNNREARFSSVVGYCDGIRIKLFESTEYGKIAKNETSGGWGYDPIFIPNGFKKSYAQIDKNDTSHRYMAFKKFARWFAHKQISSGR